MNIAWLVLPHEGHCSAHRLKRAFPTAKILQSISNFFSPSRQDMAVGTAYSIRSYLRLLIAAILVPMIVLVAYLAWNHGTASRRTIEAERLDVVNNLSHLIDREIKETSGFLTGIATSPGLQAGHAETQRRVTNVVLGAGFVGLAIFDPTSRLIFSEPEAIKPAFADIGAVGVDAILGGRQFHVSNLVAAGGAKLFLVSVPIMVDGKVASVLSGALPVQRLQKLFAESGLFRGGELGLRDAWSAGVVDGKGIILARSQRPEAFVGELAQAAMAKATAEAATSGLFDNVSRDGFDIKNAFQRNPEIGWTVGVAVPAAVVNAPLRETALTMAAIGLGLILLSVLLGSLVASRIACGVHQLGYAAVGLASGDVVPLAVSRTAQISDVSHALEAAAAAAQRRKAKRSVGLSGEATTDCPRRWVRQDQLNPMGGAP